MSVAAEGRRVALREFREEDVAAVDVWHGEAVQVAYGGVPPPGPLHHGRQVSRPRERGERSGEWTIEEDRALVVELVEEPEPIGMAEYDVGDGWLTVRFIALAKPYRGWGDGSEGGRLLGGRKRPVARPRRGRPRAGRPSARRRRAPCRRRASRSGVPPTWSW